MKLVTGGNTINMPFFGILIHTSVKLVTHFRQKIPSFCSILIHTSVKLVTEMLEEGKSAWRLF